MVLFFHRCICVNMILGGWLSDLLGKPSNGMLEQHAFQLE